MGMRICFECKRNRPCCKNRVTKKYRCNACYMSEWAKKNRDGFRRRKQRWRRRPDNLRHEHLFSRYGITLKDYNRILKNQNGKCALCLEKPRGRRTKYLAVDHDHKTNRVRGLLCLPCNTKLGNYELLIENPRLELYLVPP